MEFFKSALEYLRDIARDIKRMQRSLATASESSPQSFLSSVASGAFQGKDLVQVSGVTDVDIADTGQDIFVNSTADEDYPFPAVADELIVTTTDVQDTNYAFATNDFTGDQPEDGETVIFGGKTYTAQTVLTNVDGNVLRDVSAAAFVANLVAAANLGAGAGTTYAALTTINPTYTASDLGGDVLKVVKKTPGTDGDAVGGTISNAWSSATTLLGTGVRSVELKYISDEYELTETLHLNGGALSTGLDVLRVNSFKALTVGSGSDSAGVITLDVDTDELAEIPAGSTQLNQAVYSVPKGKRATVVGCDVQVATASAVVTVTVKYRTEAGPWFVVGTGIVNSDINPNGSLANLDATVIPENSDIVAEATSDTDNTLVSVRLSIVTDDFEGF